MPKFATGPARKRAPEKPTSDKRRHHTRKKRSIMYCSKCGREIAEGAACPECGTPAAKTTVVPANVSEKVWLTSVLLCFFLGSLGIHSFYAGKTGIGIAQLLTMGGCGVWTLIDFIMLLCGSYKDSEGKAIVNK